MGDESQLTSHREEEIKGSDHDMYMKAQTTTWDKIFRSEVLNEECRVQKGEIM